jgi:hypothetical protein
VDEQQWIDEYAGIAPDLEGFFLGRLASLLVRQVTAVSLDERQLLGRDILATFLDCMDLGLGAQACALLDQVGEMSDLGTRLAA